MDKLNQVNVIVKHEQSAFRTSSTSRLSLLVLFGRVGCLLVWLGRVLRLAYWVFLFRVYPPLIL